eukprot:g28455.t1
MNIITFSYSILYGHAKFPELPRKKRRCCAFMAVAFKWEVQNRSVDVDGGVFSSLLSEVDNQFFSFANIERQIVFIALWDDCKAGNMVSSVDLLYCKKLQKVMCTVQTIMEANLPSMDSVYMARCRGKVANIIKDPRDPRNGLLQQLQKPDH